MNTKHISLTTLAMVALLASCTHNPIETPSDSNRLADLELTSVNSVQTKAAIDGTTFPTDGKIGLFLFADETAVTPYGDGYANVEYSYNGNKGKWTASPSIKVGSTPGYLYGYYPYSSSATDVKAIPVASSLNGDDVMYASPVTNVTDKTASQTSITMNHALARVAVTVMNKSYTGAAKLSSIKFAGAETSASGTLNAINGNITATKSDVTLDVPAACQDITATGTTYDCLLVPSKVETGRQDVALTLTIDGQDKTASLSGDNGVIIAQNTKSNITITLSNSGISVKTVSVDEWNEVEVGGHKVSIKIAEDVVPHDILTEAYVDGDDVIIRASSFQGLKLVCDVGDNAKCGKTVTDGKFAFSITEICSDIEAILGYAPFFTIAVSSDSNGMAWIGDDESMKRGRFQIEDEVVIHAAANDKFRLFKWNDNSRETTRTVTVGATDAEYSASFIYADFIPGLFSVNSSGKKVFFSKGNLFCSGVAFNDDGSVNDMTNAQWGFETNQYGTTPSRITARDNNHISHFMWCSTADKAMALKYDSNWNNETTFFATKDFTVNGFSAWSTFTNDEWDYLLNTRVMENSSPRYTNVSGVPYGGGITIEGVVYGGLFIYPDDYSGKEVGDETETWTWDNINSAGIVFLPAAGYRDGDPSYDSQASVSDVSSCGYYWSSSSKMAVGASALGLQFRINSFVSKNIPRQFAYSVRLVAEYQSEPNAE